MPDARSGQQSFRSAPIDVRDFATAELTGWRSQYVGTGTAFSIRLEESVDLLTWRTVADSAVVPAADTEESTSCEFEMPWVRVWVSLGGTDVGVTAWYVGTFTRRDR